MVRDAEERSPAAECALRAAQQGRDRPKLVFARLGEVQGLFGGDPLAAGAVGWIDADRVWWPRLRGRPGGALAERHRLGLPSFMIWVPQQHIGACAKSEK
jgi:hypothetical protein